MDFGLISDAFASNFILAVIIFYMVLMICIGYYFQRKSASGASDYLIADKRVGPLMLGGTIFSTNWCGGVLLGAAGTAYAGYVASTIGDPWATCMTLILVAAFFCVILRKLKIASLTEVYRIRFGKRGAVISTVICIICMMTWTASNIVALTTIFKLFTPFNPYLCAILAGFVVVLYTYLGGMLAVVWTDNIQAIMIMLGLIILIPTGIVFVGGFDVMSAATPEGFWNILPNNAPAVVEAGYGLNPVGIIGWIAALCGMGFGYIASVELTQRVLCARDTSAARKGLVLGSGLYALAGFFSMMVAAIAIVMVSQGVLMPSGEPLGELLSEDGNFVLLALAEILFDGSVMGPIGLVLMALFIGSLLAAIMSTTSSTVFASSAAMASLIKHGSLADFSTESAEMLALSKKLVIVIGVFAVLVSFLIESLYWMMIFSFTILFNCIFWCLIGALFWKNCNATGAIAAMIIGFCGVIGCIIAQSICLGEIAIEPHDSLWVAIQTFVPWMMSGAAMFIASHLTRKSDPPVALCDTDGYIVKWDDLERSEGSQKAFERASSGKKTEEEM